MAHNGNGAGRPGIKEVAQRKALVLQLYEKGVEPQEMAAMRIGNYKTILKDVNEIHARWLANEPQWYDQSRLAKKMAEAQLKQQLRRLFAYLADEAGVLSWKEKFYVESLIANCITKLYEITSSFDPIHYKKMIIEERKSITLVEDNERFNINTGSKEGSSSDNGKGAPKALP